MYCLEAVQKRVRDTKGHESLEEEGERFTEASGHCHIAPFLKKLVLELLIDADTWG